MIGMTTLFFNKIQFNLFNTKNNKVIEHMSSYLISSVANLALSNPSGIEYILLCELKYIIARDKVGVGVKTVINNIIFICTYHFRSHSLVIDFIQL